MPWKSLTYLKFSKILKDHLWLHKDNIYWEITGCKLFAILSKKNKQTNKTPKSIQFFFLALKEFLLEVYAIIFPAWNP